ncbi:hypothetical protein NC653_003708 [Populus alba x Populus x berolinensis]|uniref:Uncharacterized protein n=1 Tax=Populus alba x Populus x berolinensis TaxID=444605 RepID=A0AAD6RS81_9ROSI|nr:hypothetical protein NC653_003708 [Populus alba x Populus x berolinensis]
MSMLISISPPAAQSFFLADSSGSKKKQFLSIRNPLRSPTVTPLSSSFTTFNPLRLSIKSNEMMMKVKRKEPGRGFGVVCHAGSITTPSLHWISALSSVVLVLVKGTAVQKSFLVPLFALQAPPAVISWIKYFILFYAIIDMIMNCVNDNCSVRKCYFFLYILIKFSE